MELVAEINAAYRSAMHHKAAMDESAEVMREIEEEVKLENREAWASAKNNDVRAIELLDWIRESDRAEEYHKARRDYTESRAALRIALLDCERLKLLVQLQGGA